MQPRGFAAKGVLPDTSKSERFSRIPLMIDPDYVNRLALAYSPNRAGNEARDVVKQKAK